MNRLMQLLSSFMENRSPYPADVYSWNFGDGQTGWGQDVSHSFDPGLGNQFLVQLTTFSYDPVSGDSCTAFSEQWIYIGNSSNCEADFYYLPDSSATISGAFLLITPPEILPAGFGISEMEYLHRNKSCSYIYRTRELQCLPDNYQGQLGNFCTDTYCAKLIFKQLTAGFSFNLDTLSGLTRQLLFYG